MNEIRNESGRHRSLIIVAVCLMVPAVAGLVLMTAVKNRKIAESWLVFDRAVITEPASSNVVLERGGLVYRQYCLGCHGDKGQGGVGKPLTLDVWQKPEMYPSLFDKVAGGVPSTSMVAWKNSLMPEDVHAVASYVSQKLGR